MFQNNYNIDYRVISNGHKYKIEKFDKKCIFSCKPTWNVMGHGDDYWFPDIFDSFKEAEEKIDRLKADTIIRNKAWKIITKKDKEESKVNNNYNEVIYLREKVLKLEKELEEEKNEMYKIKNKAKEELEWILSDNNKSLE